MIIVSVGTAEVQDDAVQMDATSFSDWDEAVDFARTFMERTVGDFLDADNDTAVRQRLLDKQMKTNTLIWHGMRHVTMTYRCDGLVAAATVVEDNYR